MGLNILHNSYYEKIVATGEVECIDEEIPFEIPKGWEWCRWGDISYSIQYGYNAPAETNGDVKMVRISDIQNNTVLWNNVPYCHIRKDEIGKYLLQSNDILFARTGGTVGKSFLVKDIQVPAIYAGYLICTRYSPKLNAQYMKTFMESQLYWKQLKDGTIATAQPNCNGKTLAKMILPIPPQNEQNRIISRLNKLRPFLEHYKHLKDDFDRLNKNINNKLKKSILQEAIQGKLVPQKIEETPAKVLLEEIKMEKQKLFKEGKLKKSALISSSIFRGDDNKYYEKIGNKTLDISDEIPFEIPENWCWCRLGSLFEHNTGKALNTANREGKKLKYITTSNLYWGFFDFSNIKQMYFKESEIDKYSIRKGDLLVCEGGDIGRSAIWKYNYSLCIQNHIHRLRAFSYLNIKFYYFIFQAYKYIGLIGGKGIGIQGLSSRKLHNIPLPLPPIKEQYKIVSKIETLFKSLHTK